MSQLSFPPFPGQDSSPFDESNDRVNRPTKGDRDNQNQNRFRANLYGFGVQRTNYFHVTITPPNAIIESAGGVFTEAYRDIQIYAESVNLPGVNFGTTQNRRQGIGYQQRYVNDVTFNDLSITFINSGSMYMSKIFTDWMNCIVRFNEPMETPTASNSGLLPFEIEYKSEYVAGEFYIVVFDERKDWISEYKIYEAFPISMSDISMSWSNNDEFAKFTVNFAYSFWDIKYNEERPAPVLERVQSEQGVV